MTPTIIFIIGILILVAVMLYFYVDNRKMEKEIEQCRVETTNWKAHARPATPKEQYYCRIIPLRTASNEEIARARQQFNEAKNMLDEVDVLYRRGYKRREKVWLSGNIPFAVACGRCFNREQPESRACHECKCEIKTHYMPKN